eukprot:GILI01014967.1.p1 GENE.GILI01014967.1~~GILI01014967.1.p1  ORF type:complete len:468 (+),score=80.18 GILI01014967.1:49-1404(+)
MGCFCRVRDHFVRKPVIRNHQQEPTSRFGMTDFPEPVDWTLIEDLADAMLVAAPIGSCDVIVSIADRCGGAIAHAIALRTGLPYTLANWYPLGSPGEVEIGQCAGFSGDGVIYLNGLKRGKNVAIVGDVIKSGSTVTSLLKGIQAAGCHATCIVAGCEILETNGRAAIAAVNSAVPVFAVTRIHARGEQTKAAEDLDGKVLPPTPVHLQKREGYPFDGKKRIAEIKRMSVKELQEKTERIHKAFVGIPIIRNDLLSYPYSFFGLTDFTPAMEASWVEDLADLCVYHGNFDNCDVVVSECDRGGGPMIQAICARVNKPFVLANWYPSVDGCGMSSNVQIGFSGVGNIVVNGLKPGDRCIIIDDMLSSGGTAEGIINSIAMMGAIPSVGIFASEKLYPSERDGGIPVRKGAIRLRKAFPYFGIVSICQFIAEGDKTQNPSIRIGDDASLTEEV